MPRGGVSRTPPRGKSDHFFYLVKINVIFKTLTVIKVNNDSKYSKGNNNKKKLEIIIWNYVIDLYDNNKIQL